VILAGMITKIEVWDKSCWDDYQNKVLSEEELEHLDF